MKIKRKIVLAFFLLCLISLGAVHSVKSQWRSVIVINPDGSISGTDRIQRNGALYELKDDLFNSQIIVECSNIIVDGGGFTLQGAGSWGTTSAINLTCSNVTVRNFQISGWEVGIMGAYDENSILNNSLTKNKRNIALYADNYYVDGNYIAQGDFGIRIQGNNNTVVKNHIVNNAIQFWITLSSGNIITANIIEADENTLIETDGGGYQIFQNNFLINNLHYPIRAAYPPDKENEVVLPPWDNGKVGNYWSDYNTKYPNATEIDNSGVANFPYVVNVNPNVTDRFPLINPVNISIIASLSPSPASTPSPSYLEFPSWIILPFVIVIALFVILTLKRKTEKNG